MTNAASTRTTPQVLDLLTQARDHVAEGILQDLLKLGQAAPAMLNTKAFPEDTPPWLIIAALESLMPDGSVCWDIARAHLTNLTAARLACVRIKDAPADLVTDPEKATGHDLAKTLGLSLHSFAGECWASLGAVQEAPNV